MDGRAGTAGKRSRFLDAVERLGNALPDPIFIFVVIIFVLVGVSMIGASAGWSAVNPVTGETLAVSSLLSEANVVVTHDRQMARACSELGLAVA